MKVDNRYYFVLKIETLRNENNAIAARIQFLERQLAVQEGQISLLERQLTVKDREKGELDQENGRLKKELVSLEDSDRFLSNTRLTISSNDMYVA
jgi:uncharacterized coiled-coil protein SlyX